MHETYYKIADIVIKIESPFPFYAANGEDFRCLQEEPDYCFDFVQVSDIPEIMEGAELTADVMWAHEYRRPDGVFLRAFLWQEKYYSEVSIIGKKKGICYYTSAGILRERAEEGFEMLMYLCLEQILIQFGGLVLHSSHIDVNGKGIVFSAPSQTGKSTQAELWQRYAGARIINGDRSVLRKLDGRWYVCGCPMCGTSNIHLQSMEPLSHIVMLAQSPKNTVRRLSGLEALRLIYPQITVSSWNTAYVEQAMDLMDQLLQEVPVWYYACTKEPDAVHMLKAALEL